jgi:hypothetical protein
MNIVRRFMNAAKQRGRAALNRTFTIFFLSPARLAVGVGGIAPMMAYFKSLTIFPGVRELVVVTWQRGLQRLGYSSTAAEWIDWVCERWPNPRYRLYRLELLRDLRRFDEATTLLQAEREALFSGPSAKTLFNAVVDLEATLAIEKGDVPPDAAAFANGRGDAIARFCYQRAWDAHGALNGGRVRHYLNYYFHAVDYDPDVVVPACDSLMFPNALWREALEALQRAEATLERKKFNWRSHFEAEPQASRTDAMLGRLKRRTSDQDTREAIYLRMANANFELGDFARVREILSTELRASRFHSCIAGRLKLREGDGAGGRALLARAYADRNLPRRLRAELAGDIAVSYEEERDFDTARQYYVSSYQVGGIPHYLPEYLWRYVSLCAAQASFAEAAMVLDQALPHNWKYFARLSKKNIKARLREDQQPPSRGAFIVGCWGIGDDIIRMAMFEALYGKMENVRFGLSVDPRMKGLYARSFKNFEVVPISRMNGPFAVSEAEHYRLRDGLPPDIDGGRLDANVYQATERYADTALTEDFLNAFFRAGANVRRPAEPMFQLLPEKREAARRWLAKLPPGLNVGISWRGGERNLMRDKSYTDIVADWGDILTLDGINIINLQYSWQAEELREAELRHGCVIHTPPFDLKNDIEDIVALSREVDVVLAPGTAVREMCAAAGANVWSLTTTPLLPDLWRLDSDRQTDRLFPNMRHVTAYDYGDAQGVLREISKRLQEMAAAVETRHNTSPLVAHEAPSTIS